jgi:hypothetical protein
VGSQQEVEKRQVVENQSQGKQGENEKERLGEKAKDLRAPDGVSENQEGESSNKSQKRKLNEENARVHAGDYSRGSRSREAAVKRARVDGLF